MPLGVKVTRADIPVDNNRGLKELEVLVSQKVVPAVY
jgi:hypothetical protein